MIIEQVKIDCDFLEELTPDATINSVFELHEKFFHWSCLYKVEMSFEKLGKNYCQVNLTITEKEDN